MRFLCAPSRRWSSTAAGGAKDVKPEQRLANELSVCASTRNLVEGRRIHALIASCWLGRNKYLANQLIRMYGKCGAVDEARRVFDSIHRPSLYSWNTIIAAYAWNGRVAEASDIFRRIPSPDSVSWNALFQAYAQAGLPAEATQIFNSMPNKDIVSYNAMLSLLASSGAGTSELKRFFDRVPEPNAVTWNTLCQTLATEGFTKEAKEVFDAMPSGRSLVASTIMITAFADADDADGAQEFFDRMPQRDFVCWNAMAAARTHSGHLQLAKVLFDQTPERDVVSWTLLVVGNAEKGSVEQAEAAFSRMPLRSVVSWNVMVQAYAQNGYLETARFTFDSMPMRTNISWNLIVAAYADAGQAQQARLLFDAVPDKDAVAWATMVAGYVQNGYLEEAQEVFELMPQKTIVAWSSLIAAFAHAAEVESARRVFDLLPGRNLYSWNSMLSAYAQNGYGTQAVELFRQMVQEGGTMPDPIAFMSLLTACNHVGLVEVSWEQFVSMRSDFGIGPRQGHYRCMIDVLARSGRLMEAEELMATMPFAPDDIAWGSLLSACKTHRNADVGERAAQAAMGVEPNEPATYVLLQNLYASTGREDKVAMLRRTMREKGVKKQPGLSTIEIGAVAHRFVVNESSHPRNEEIRKELRRLLTLLKQSCGYIPNTEEVLHKVTMEEKEELLMHHSEKMAVVLGLLETQQGTPLRVIKNLRVCNDCHSVIKMLSGMCNRRITVRDANRFHHFENGRCSCKDYW